MSKFELIYNSIGSSIWFRHVSDDCSILVNVFGSNGPSTTLVTYNTPTGATRNITVPKDLRRFLAHHSRKAMLKWIRAFEAQPSNAEVSCEQEVCNEIMQRQVKGINKYGQSVDQNDGDLHYWLQHLLEELSDAAVYVRRVQKEIDRILRELSK